MTLQANYPCVCRSLFVNGKARKVGKIGKIQKHQSTEAEQSARVREETLLVYLTEVRIKRVEFVDLLERHV